jgi:methoxymalonate biosynthesis acyl carrier protein
VTISPADRTDSARVADELRQFLEAKLRTPIRADLDLFSSGTVSSMFAMELVVHLERTFGIVVAGPDLMMDNFRTVDAMTALVQRLRVAPGA